MWSPVFPNNNNKNPEKNPDFTIKIVFPSVVFNKAQCLFLLKWLHIVSFKDAHSLTVTLPQNKKL